GEPRRRENVAGGARARGVSLPLPADDRGEAERSPHGFSHARRLHPWPRGHGDALEGRRCHLAEPAPSRAAELGDLDGEPVAFGTRPDLRGEPLWLSLSQ